MVIVASPGQIDSRQRRPELVNRDVVEAAKEHFGKVLEGQLARVDQLNEGAEWTDFSNVRPIIIGILGGDGIGPSGSWSICWPPKSTRGRWSFAPSRG